LWFAVKLIRHFPGRHLVAGQPNCQCGRPIRSGRGQPDDEDGHGETFGPGSAFVIPAGFKGSWETLESLKKYYAIFQPQTSPSPAP